jgi:GTPase SAR1 family protein
MIPDWAKGHQKINDLCNDINKIDPDVMHLGKKGLGDLLKIRETLHKYLEQIELCYRNHCGSLVCLEFFPYRIWVTGGQSWGDAPSDLYYPIEMMNRLSVLDAVGFNPVLPNYRKMIRTIIKNKDIQPLLLHMDPDLDKLLEKEFRNDSDIHKKQVPGNPPRPSRKHKKVGKTSP